MLTPRQPDRVELTAALMFTHPYHQAGSLNHPPAENRLVALQRSTNTMSSPSANDLALDTKDLFYYIAYLTFGLSRVKYPRSSSKHLRR